MRSILLTSVAAAGLLAGLVTAPAQQLQPGSGKQPAAAERSQLPIAPDADRSREPGISRTGNKTREPHARAQKKQQANEQADEPASRRQTTGQSSDTTADQSQRGQAPDQRRAVQDREPVPRRSTAGPSNESRSTYTPRRDNSPRTNTARDRGDDRGARASLRLSEDERTRVTARFSDRIDRMDVRPLSRSQISISIGATVPRSIRLYSVPSDVVEIYPRFRGHRFVLVEDEIVIIEPRSRRVVAVLPSSREARNVRGGVRETTGTAAAAARLHLTPEERRIVRTTVMREPACRLEQRVEFFLFMPMPKTVEVCQMPSELISAVPTLSSYRYTVRGDEVVLVDPEDDRVVEIIE